MANKNSSSGFISTVSDNSKKKRNLSKFDAAKLRELILAGKTAKEIMEILGLSHKQQLKHFVLRLCNLEGRYFDVPGLYGQNARQAYVNAKGQVIIKTALVNWNGLLLEPDKTLFNVKVDAEHKKITLSVIDHIPVRANPPTEDRLTLDEGDDAPVV